jgi:hypothetical protein
VRKIDITHRKLPSDLKSRDVAISFEVAEHLPEAYADRFVNLMCLGSDNVVVSAATPGQGGLDHVNEQPHEYWISKFSQRGYGYDERLSLDWRNDWQEKGVDRSYYNNVMVFRSFGIDVGPRPSSHLESR